MRPGEQTLPDEAMVRLGQRVMVDIHHHLLPGLDDGPSELETSVAMSRAAANDGITHVVCTPHSSGQYVFDPAAISERLSTLRDAIAKESIPITLGTGCDFHLSFDNVQDARANPRKYTINATEYLLIELADSGIPPAIRNTFYDLRLAGMTLILTHPERNPSLQRTPSLLADWVREGMLIQITANSVLGHMGRKAEHMSKELLRKRWVNFIATDAHNLTSRAPRLRAAYDLVAQQYGEKYAHILCMENPMAVFRGDRLPPQFEPLHLYQEMVEIKVPWWKRLLGED